MKSELKIIISGGGTGGHIFPALAIADEIIRRDDGADILFVGAAGRMEMEKVPAAGYRIVGLPVKGFRRSFSPANLRVVLALLRSIWKAVRIIRQFKPHVVIGVGGYASGPLLWVASGRKIPTLIQEQNSYAGITNRWLAKRVDRVCVAYMGMDRYFPALKVVYTGNPVRRLVTTKFEHIHEARAFFGIPEGANVLLILGGSLGARTINQSVIASLDQIGRQKSTVVVWQTGKIYFKEAQEALLQSGVANIRAFDFIHRMDLAYGIADVVVSRAGALSISEIAIAGKPAILVPSPNVAEDHQTKNALALTEAGAALFIADAKAVTHLIPEALKLITDKGLCNRLTTNVLKIGVANATERIVDEVYKLIDEKYAAR